MADDAVAVRNETDVADVLGRQSGVITDESGGLDPGFGGCRADATRNVTHAQCAGRLRVVVEGSRQHQRRMLREDRQAGIAGGAGGLGQDEVQRDTAHGIDGNQVFKQGGESRARPWPRTDSGQARFVDIYHQQPVVGKAAGAQVRDPVAQPFITQQRGGGCRKNLHQHGNEYGEGGDTCPHHGRQRESMLQEYG